MATNPQPAQTGVLHTNPGWYYQNQRITLLDKPFESRKKDSLSELQQKQEELENRERELYSAFGERDYKGFIEKIRKNTTIINQDRPYLESFRSEAIGNMTKEWYSSSKTRTNTENIEIVFSVKNGSGEFSAPGSSKTQKTISISAYPDVAKLKTQLNKMRKVISANLREKKGTKNSNKRERQATPFNPSSSAYDGVRYFLNNDFSEVAADCLNITIKQNRRVVGHATTEQEVKEVVGYLSFRHEIYGYTRNEIKAWYNSSDKVQQAHAQEIINKLGADLRSRVAGGSKQLKDAFEETWKTYCNDIDKVSKLFVGLDLEKQLSGSQGEFFATLFPIYIKKLFGNTKKEIQSTLVTELNSFKEEMKTDVIWKIGGSELGIQVKNYRTFASKTDATNEKLTHAIESKQHPAELGEYFSGTEGANLCDFLANYFFHKTTQKMYGEQFLLLKEALLSRFSAEVLRLQYNGMANTNSFYLIDGKYLVPGSQILQWYIEQIYSNEMKNDDLNVSISSSYSPLPNNYNWREENEYWYRGKGGYWHTTDKGKTNYTSLAYGDKITIKTQFKNIRLADFSFYN